MPGEILQIRVKVGDSVKKNQPLATISAMKMETVVAAPRDGKVTEIFINEGQKMQGDDLLFVLA